MQGMEEQPHIKLTKKDLTPVVLVVGDPARTLMVAEMCDTYEFVAHNREYRSVKCVKDGMTFLVVSHGVGSAGAAICFEELIHLGAKVIIRAGTSGLLSKDLRVGDVVLCEAAVRDDGASLQYIPAGFPATSDMYVYEKLRNAAKELNLECHSGYTFTSDAFYQSKFSKEKLTLYAESNVSIVEMEVATLFVLGKLRGIRTGALCCVDGCPLGDHSQNYDPIGLKMAEGKQKMLKIALTACVSIAKEFAENN